MRFFLMLQGSFSPKIRFLGQKVCSVARGRTDRQTDRHESENRGHPFKVSGFFQIFLQPIIKERSNLNSLGASRHEPSYIKKSCMHSLFTLDLTSTQVYQGLRKTLCCNCWLSCRKTH